MKPEAGTKWRHRKSKRTATVIHAYTNLKGDAKVEYRYDEPSRSSGSATRVAFVSTVCTSPRRFALNFEAIP